MKVKFFLSVVCMMLVLMLMSACGNNVKISTRISEDTVIVSLENPEGYLLMPIEYGAPVCDVEMEADGLRSMVGKISVAQTKIDDYVPIPLSNDCSSESLLILHSTEKACFKDSLKAVEELNPQLFSRKKPSYHYTMSYGYMGVPATAIFDGEKYHLYYECNPYGIRQGNSCWEHAVSEQLVSWETLPVAILGDSIGDALGGSCVLDGYSSFGAGMNSMVCLYTASRGEGVDRRQEQCIAYSRDAKSPLQKFATNPVLRTYDDIPNFRHPSVVRYKRENMWDVVVACGDHLRIYSSSDLANWNLESRLGQGWFGDNALYESGRLVEMKTSDGNPCWMLICNVKPNGEDSQTGCVAAYCGSFDGKTFKPQSEKPVLMDYGNSYFGAMTYENVSDRILLSGVLFNSIACLDETICNMMSLPREVSLLQNSEGIRPVVLPAKETEQLRKEESKHEDLTVSREKNMEKLLDAYQGAFELNLTMQGNNTHGFLLYNDKGESVKLTLIKNEKKDVLVVDRSDCYEEGAVTEIPLSNAEEHQLRIFADNGVIELFVDHGLAAFSEILPMKSTFSSVRFFADGGDMQVKNFVSYAMKVDL